LVTSLSVEFDSFSFLLCAFAPLRLCGFAPLRESPSGKSGHCLLPGHVNHSEIWLDWLDHELRQAVGSIFGLSFYMIGHPAIGPILSLLG
jgi:hypothetical protein